MIHADAILELLGGEDTFQEPPRTDLDFVAKVREGLPVRLVSEVAAVLMVSRDQLFDWIGVKPRTASRRKQQFPQSRLRPAESERLLRLARVTAGARAVFGDPERASEWLQKPCRALGHQVPVTLLDTDIGTQSVLDVLGRIEHGVYS